jgi:hypothetical protein
MTAPSPVIVAFTRHAERRAVERGLALPSSPNCCSPITIDAYATPAERIG